MDESKQLDLQSDISEMERIEPFVEELQEWAGFGEEVYSKIVMALSEAVNNAIIHGNKKDADKTVSIEVQHTGQVLRISVSDEGEGFDPSRLPDPLKEENLLKTSGRGIYLIKQYADKVEFSEGGSCIKMNFNLHS